MLTKDEISRVDRNETIKNLSSTTKITIISGFDNQGRIMERKVVEIIVEKFGNMWNKMGKIFLTL